MAIPTPGRRPLTKFARRVGKTTVESVLPEKQRQIAIKNNPTLFGADRKETFTPEDRAKRQAIIRTRLAAATSKNPTVANNKAAVGLPVKSSTSRGNDAWGGYKPPKGPLKTAPTRPALSSNASKPSTLTSSVSKTGGWNGGKNLDPGFNFNAGSRRTKGKAIPALYDTKKISAIKRRLRSAR